MLVVQLVVLNFVHNGYRHILVIDPVVNSVLSRTHTIIHVYLILSSTDSYLGKEISIFKGVEVPM